MPPQGEDRKRLRVRTGCRTCRARHVKCDERRPACRQCSKKGRSCYYDRSSCIPEIPQEESSAKYKGREINTISIGTQNFNPTPFADSVDNRQIEINSTDLRIVESHGIHDVQSGPNRTLIPISSQASPSANLASILSVADWDPQDKSPPSASAFRTSEPIMLTGIEVVVFRNYVNRVAKWLDGFSRDKPFSSLVPSLALKCPVLLHSCLAYSARQIAWSTAGSGGRKYERLSLHWYRTALESLGDLLTSSESARSDEVLASSMILSSYEMLGVIGESFASHLKGLAALLQAQEINGDESGVRGSVFWAWYRHESWSCLLTEREMTLNETYWQPSPVENFDNMSQEEIANRVTFIYGQVISFSNEIRLSTEAAYLAARRARANELGAALADWKQKLPSWMIDFRIESDTDGCFSDTRTSSQHRSFPSLWFIYPQSATAHQAYHAALILLALHGPQDDGKFPGLGRQSSLSVRRRIERSREQIYLVAGSSIPEEQAFVSVHCLFVAGLVTEGKEERQRTLDIIEDCQRVSGRRTVCIADELRKIWSLEG